MGLSLAYELGIVLGCLVALAFGAGFIKVLMNKRKLKANTIKADAEAAAKATDKEKLVRGRPLGEGDYFGVRALEHGYFGGVAQTRSSSPASVYKLAPDAKLVDWGQVNKLRSDSASVTSSNFDYMQDRNSSVSSLPAATNGVKKPSPLRLQPSDASHNMSSVGGVGGNFLPPPPSPRSIRAPSPLLNEEKSSNWVSPLDVHFSRPGTPVRPTSFLPKLQFPLEFGKSELTVPLPDFNGPKSETASIVEQVIVKPPPTAGGRVKSPKEIYAEFSQQGFAKSPTLSQFSQHEPVRSPTLPNFSKQESQTKSPTVSTFSREPTKPTSSTFSGPPQPTQQAPPRPNRLSLKSMFSTEETPVRSPKEDFASTFQLPDVPLEDLAPALPPINPDRFPRELKTWTPTSPIRNSIVPSRQRQPPTTAGATRGQNHEWSLPSPTMPDEEMIDAQWQQSEKAIIRASVVSKQRVSVIRAAAQQSQDLDVVFAKSSSSKGRGHSMAASSMYSTRTSILEPDQSNYPKQHGRGRSQSSEARRSNSSQRVSSRSLSRTRDSVRRSRSSRKNSTEEHRRSRDRDALHFDPTSTSRDRSGSVQGRSVNFDQPRESPFSNFHKTSTHSVSSSSVSSADSLSRFETPSPPKPVLNRNQASFSFSSTLQQEEQPPMPTRIPFPQAQDPDRLSIAPPQQIHGRTGSEASQNSIGDFYDSYYRQSTMGQAQAGVRMSVQERMQVFEERGRGRSGSRPPPLKMGGFNTIVEVPSPLPGSAVDRAGATERFPSMI